MATAQNTTSIDGPEGLDQTALEEAISEVRIWASVASELTAGLRIPSAATEAERFALNRFIRVAYALDETAEDLHRVYHGAPKPPKDAAA